MFCLLPRWAGHRGLSAELPVQMLSCCKAAQSVYSELFVFIATCQRWGTAQGCRAALEVPWWAQVIMNGGSVALERASADGVTGCSPFLRWCAHNWGLFTNLSVMASHPSPAATLWEEISCRLAVSAKHRSQTPSTMEEKAEDIQENRNGPKGFISASSKCCTGVRQVRLQMSTQITPRQHEHQYRLMSRKYILSSSVLSHLGQFIHCVSSASAGHNSLLSCCVWSFGRCQWTPNSLCVLWSVLSFRLVSTVVNDSKIMK